MTTELERLAERIQEVPQRVASHVSAATDDGLRARPAPGEWSAIEVVGHLADKLEIWRRRVERVATEDRPELDPYDQDELVRNAKYQDADLDGLIGSLRTSAQLFADVVRKLADGALNRSGRHGEYGDVTLRDCITRPLDSVDDHLVQIDRALEEAN